MRTHSILRRIHVAGGAILMATLGSSRLAAFDADPNPYGVIVERNVFRLNPPPPLPSTEPATETPDLPVVAFCGTMAIGDQVRALLVVATSEANKNNRSASKETKAISYLNLATGETDGPVQLVRIHQDRQAVDIIVAGTARTLTMKDDGIAKIALPAPAPSKATMLHPNASAPILTSVAHNLRGEQGITASAGGDPLTTAGEASANVGANQSRPIGVVASSGNTIVTGNNGGDQSQAIALPGNSALQANASSGVIVSGAIPLQDSSSTSPNEEPSSTEDPAVKYHWQRTIPWLIDVTAPPPP
jgi:hypothetical protein